MGKPKTTAGATEWSVSTTPGGGWVRRRAGVYLPDSWTSVLDRADLPYTVELEFTADADGPRCEAISLRARASGKPISAAELRTIPVGACIELAIASATARGEEHNGETVIQMGGKGDLSALLRAGRPARKRQELPKEHYERVAGVYLGAAGNKPTHAVWEAWNFVPSYSTVSRWVEKARDLELIPKTKRGRRSARKEP
jgi:hypothetical protein